jgi:hypothetical protein
MSEIMTYIIHEREYERMLDLECSGIDTLETYEKFVSWNKACVDELNAEDVAWVLGLCKRIQQGVGLMDLESCATFSAHAIFFDKNKRICIVNPR